MSRPTALELLARFEESHHLRDGFLLAARVEAVLALKHPLTRSAHYDEGWFACIKQVHAALNGEKS